MKIFFLDSQYRNAFSNAILVLAEKGDLETLKQKWWKGTGLCEVSIIVK